MARRGSDAARRRDAQVDRLISVIDAHWSRPGRMRARHRDATGLFDTSAGTSLHGDVRGVK